MFDFAKQRNGDFNWGRYFETAPALPLTEMGRPFRFRWTSVDSSMEDIVVNLEHNFIASAITTTYDLGWKPDGYIVTNGEVWKILSLRFDIVRPQSATMLKKQARRYTISVVKIDNPVGL